MVSRRGLLAGAGAALAASALRAQPKQPLNLLFLMTDQHHAGWLGCAGHPLVKTPNMDRLARQGTRFGNAFAPVPYCSPTRLALMTGRYPSSLGLGRNLTENQDALRLREPTRTYAHQLADRGYHCHQLGKWHLGDPTELTCYPTPDAQAITNAGRDARRAAGDKAFDDGPRPGESELAGDVWLRQPVAEAHRRFLEQPTHPAQDVGAIGRSRLRPEYQPEQAITDRCLELMKAHRTEPFAITWSVSPPHALWTAPSPYYDQYDPAAFELPATWRQPPEAWRNSAAAIMGRTYGEAGLREYLRCYAAQITFMDALLGRLLDQLDALGLAERTLVVYTSDHGNLMGQHAMMDKTVGTFYDDLVRVPLIMRLPGAIPAGAVRDGAVSLVDLPPTLLGYLGAPPLPGCHGHDLRGVVDGREPGQDTIFAERNEPQSPNAARMVRTRDWKLCLLGRGRGELYDLARDPDETTNLFDDPARAPVVSDLTRRLRDHATAVGDPAAVASA